MINRFRQRHPALVRGTMLALAFGLSAGTGFAYASWAMVCRAGRCPSTEVLDQYEPRQTSKLYAADGRFIAELGLERRTLVRIDQVPEVVRQAFIATEDKRFYRHAGIDWIRVPGAALANIRQGGFGEGFSTISMQLARNIFPERISREKTLVRKLKEAKVARAIEARYSKDRILELYLNQIYLGNGAYGIETASQRYFGKPVTDVTLPEAALLAALPKGPERYNPRRYPDRALQRRNTVLGLMLQEEIISPNDASLARAFPLRLAARAEAGDSAPYFVEHIRQVLDERFGKQLYEQGLNVYTTLDLDMQTAAERSLERQLRAVEATAGYRHTSYERYMARSRGDETAAGANSPYLQGAFIAVDPRNGAIRALVGGRDFDDNKFNRATQALRQPGSTFKPIVYAAAVQGGRPLSYGLDDSPLAMDMGNGSEWRPQNYDGAFQGITPMRRALYQSRNIPTIRLGLEVGVQRVIEMARRFGITTPIPGYPSIFLGAADVVPLEMVASYSTFATLGTQTAPQAIVRVETSQGQVLWAPEPARVPVLSQEEAWLMVSVLRDVVRRGTAASSVGSRVSVPAGGKTGTTNDGTDVWYVGFTPDVVAGVWMGFDRPRRIRANAQGGQLAAPAWSSFVNEIYRRRPAPRDWVMPPGIVARTVDVGTGLLATDFCPRDVVATEFFIQGTDPIYECSEHLGNYYYQPDTLGIGAYPPTGYPPYPPVGTIDTTRPRPADTLGRRPSTVFPRRDSLGRIIEPPVRPDTLRPPAGTPPATPPTTPPATPPTVPPVVRPPGTPGTPGTPPAVPPVIRPPGSPPPSTVPPSTGPPATTRPRPDSIRIPPAPRRP
jgi:penicillin-binding protein 1A